MRVRSGNTIVGLGNFDPELSPGVANFIANFGKRPAPVDAAQARVVVKRLRVLIGEGIENAKRCEATLTAEDLVKVCDDLIRETRENGFRPDYGDSVKGFILSGIFDELLMQPSNIFDVERSLDGGNFYVPLSAETWVACLEALRLSLAPEKPLRIK